MSIDKKLFKISLVFLALIPVGFVLEEMLKIKGIDVVGFGVVFLGMVIGLPCFIISLGVWNVTPSNHDEVIERLDRIEKAINLK